MIYYFHSLMNEHVRKLGKVLVLIIGLLFALALWGGMLLDLLNIHALPSVYFMFE